jgi:hypothetical protein
MTVSFYRFKLQYNSSHDYILPQLYSIIVVMTVSFYSIIVVMTVSFYSIIVVMTVSFHRYTV